MVKNVSGGSNNKKFARKNMAPSRSNNKLRISEEEGEIYAVVVKIFGGRMCQVQCIDGVTRSCIIRGKFTGRGKRDNTLSAGVWVLVGIREWESSTSQKCDLLEIYSDADKIKLQHSVSGNWQALIIQDGTHSTTLAKDDIFHSEATEEYQNMILTSGSSAVIGLHPGNINEGDGDEDEDINIDDI